MDEKKRGGGYKCETGHMVHYVHTVNEEGVFVFQRFLVGIFSGMRGAEQKHSSPSRIHPASDKYFSAILKHRCAVLKTRADLEISKHSKHVRRKCQ